MEKEKWKDINGFENLYQISNYGNVKSLERHNYRYHHIKEKILKPSKNRKGYLTVTLWKDKKSYTKIVHILVAKAFIPNPNNFETVNHIDENKENNFETNLEWCSYKFNNNYGTRNERISQSLSKKINQFDLNGTFIKQWKNSIEAGDSLGIDSSSIRKCCLKQQKTCGGYIWKSI